MGVFGAVLLLGLLGICAFMGIQLLQYRRECAHLERLVQEANQTLDEVQVTNNNVQKPYVWFRKARKIINN